MKSALPLVSRWEASFLVLSALAAAGCGGRGTLYADELDSSVGGSDTGGGGTGGSDTGGTGGVATGGTTTGGAPPVGGSTGRPCTTGAQCEDFSSCTLDTCNDGVCSRYDIVDDGNPCTIDYCDPDLGAQHVLASDDGNPCTMDVCDRGVVSNPPVNVDDNNPCTIDYCDPAFGIGHWDIAIDDGNACTLDFCDPNFGVVHQPLDVNDNNACTVDGCDIDFGPTHTPILCNADACSIAKCDPVLGCITAPRGCVDNDGCCPAGCSLNTDSDCCGINLAASATPSTSEGGLASYSPAQLNNGLAEANDCFFYSWVKSSQTPSGAYFEYAWPTPVTIRSIYIDTANGTSGNPCNPTGRNVKSASVQYWTGSAWATATTFGGQHDDIALTLPSPVTTTRLRLFDVTTDPGNGNALIHEWYVYGAAGCAP
jgi:hypothetical protein